MTTQINREAYQKLIDEDLEFISRMPSNVWRSHIEQVLRWSISVAYQDPSEELQKARADLREIVKLVGVDADDDPVASVEEYVEQSRAVSRTADQAIQELGRLKNRADSYGCDRCFAIYGMDAHVPDEIWAKLAAKADGSAYSILCLWCMEEIAKEKGIVYKEVGLYWPGGNLSAALPWTEVCREGQKDEWIRSLQRLARIGAKAIQAVIEGADDAEKAEATAAKVVVAWEHLRGLVE